MLIIYQEKNGFFVTCEKWHETQVSIKFSSFLYLISIIIFSHQGLNWKVVIEILWPIKPKIFTVWTLTKGVCQPLVEVISFSVNTLLLQKHSVYEASLWGLHCRKWDNSSLYFDNFLSLYGVSVTLGTYSEGNMRAATNLTNMF